MNLQALNSATKYPSIPTYHALGDRGALTEDVTVFTGEVILAEKINGGNSRVILMPDGDWFIGSRDELLTARGDRIPNPALGITEVLSDIAENLQGGDTDQVAVFYLETYGVSTRISGAKQYTGNGLSGARMFDIAFIPVEVLGWEPVKIAAWRDHGGQKFATGKTLQRAAEAEGIPLVPQLGTCPAGDLPVSVEDTYTWLAGVLPRTLAALDENAGGKPEGIVLRAADRSVIAKARFEDYARTLRRRAETAAAS